MINKLIRAHLEKGVRRRRRLRLWRKLALCWTIAACFGLAMIAFQHGGGWKSALVPPLTALLGAVAAFVVVRRNGRAEPDWHALATEIETRHPELDGRLLTALEQSSPAGGELNYLQDRLVRETALHSLHHDWAAVVPESRLLFAHLAHLAALGLFFVVLSKLQVTGGHTLFAKNPESGISVTPGDVSLERGSSLVVLARFNGPLPAKVDLVVSPGSGTGRQLPLVKSLADPVFGGSVPDVSSNLVYHVEYAGGRTPDYKVTVFEYPRLERADADLTFPDYTGQEPKRIENTRRVSAVQGSQLGLSLQFNKPVTSARLVPRDAGAGAVALTVESNRPLGSLSGFALETSRTYELQLTDTEGRTNRMQSQFVFVVLSNRAPELKIASPRGDTRPSLLEEVAFEGTVWDDFGIRAYGIAYTLVGQETKFVELGRDVPANEKRAFKHLLRLEDLGVKPDELIAWYVWADDLGPDGQVRRTPGDMYFAEVRPFDEIFREGDAAQQAGQGNQQGQQGGATRLVDLQKQIINATWRLQREQGVGKKPAPAPAPGAKPASESKPAQKQSSADAPARSAGFQPAVSPISNRPRVEMSAAPAGSKPAIPQIENLRYAAVLPQFAGQPAPGSGGVERGVRSDRAPRDANAVSPLNSSTGQYSDDAGVVRDSEAQAIEQARTAMQRGQGDPRTAALWQAAIERMEHAQVKLSEAAGSPGALPQALIEEQAAYQALLKLQEHEYQISRNRSQAGGSGRQQQMQMQLDQMDLTQPENRYETQRQAQAPASAERREQLQVMNRLQELARRQQDLNERLKELQTALQEARTETEREEIRRQLKRLQEEEQSMLADVDELRQRMDQPDNQSRMSDERRQLDQTRQDVQRAADAAGQGTPSQALASGTRAQRQLQDMRDQMRRENSSQFADDLREMRAEARELARQQEDLVNRMDRQAGAEQKSLSDSGERQAMLDQIAKQRARLTNLVDRASQISQDAESSEPLLSRQLYDTVRQFSQDTGKDLKETQDHLISSGFMTRNLYDQLQQPSDADGAKLMDVTSEMLRLDLHEPAQDSARRARTGINDLAGGVERAARSVLGDDTESLRLAQQQLDRLTEQLQREMTQARGGGTNQQPGEGGTGDATRSGAQQRAENGSGAETNSAAQSAANGRSARPGQAQADSNGQNSGQQARAGNRNGQRSGEQNNSQENQSGQRTPGEGNQETASAENAGQQGEQPGGGQGQQGGQGQRGGARGGQQGAADQLAQDQQSQAQAQEGQGGNGARNGGRRGGNRGANRSGSSLNNATGGSEGASGFSSVLDQVLDSGGSGWAGGPITGEDFMRWSDGLRDVEEMIQIPDLRNDVARARDRARVLRQQYRRTSEKPDWAVVRLQVVQPLVEVRDRIAEELARRGSEQALVPLDRDPVPNRYSDLVKRYYEELGKDK